MMESIIGLDIGTTGCKATLFDRDGAVRHQAYREYPVGAYTGSISADMIWEQVQQVIRACTAQTPEIAAICATSFGEVVVPVDAAGHTLAEAMLYTNAAAQAQWKRLDEKLGGKRIHMITGHVSHSMYTISNLMRIRETEPEAYAKTAKFLFISSFINYRLTGVAATETSLAARSMAYDVCSGVWSSEIFAAADVEITKMAELIDAGTPLGSVLPEVAAELGMSGKPTVFAGGHDQPCVALGLGAVRGGDAVYGMGSVDCLTYVMDSVCLSDTMRRSNLVCTPHVVPGKFISYGVLFSGGVVLRQVRNMYYPVEYAKSQQDGSDVYDRMMHDAEQAPDGLLYLPHLTGSGTPYMDVRDSGVLYGLRLDTTRGEIVRAAVQGLAFDMRLNIENLRRAGLPVQHIRVAGGGAKSEISLQLRADAMAEPLQVPTDVQAGARGAFLLAAKGLGWIDSYTQLPCTIARTVEPRRDTEQAYRRFLQLYQLLQPMKQA